MRRALPASMCLVLSAAVTGIYGPAYAQSDPCMEQLKQQAKVELIDAGDCNAPSMDPLVKKKDLEERCNNGKAEAAVKKACTTIDQILVTCSTPQIRGWHAQCVNWQNKPFEAWREINELMLGEVTLDGETVRKLRDHYKILETSLSKKYAWLRLRSQRPLPFDVQIDINGKPLDPFWIGREYPITDENKEIVVRAPGRISRSIPIPTLNPGEKSQLIDIPELELELAPLPPPPKPPYLPPVRIEQPSSSPKAHISVGINPKLRRGLMLGFGGASMTSFIAGTISGLLADDRFEIARSNALCANGRCTDFSGAAAANKGFQFAYRADFAFVMGAFFAVTGMSLLLVPVETKSPARSVSGSISLQPSFDGASGGVSLWLRF